jgi:hypothetical protein
MKTKIITIAIAAIVFAGATATSCKSKQQPQNTASKNPFAGGGHSMPCNVFDCDEYFAATGIGNGSRNRMDVIQQNALTNAQNIIRQKMQHYYEGFVDNFSDAIGNNRGTDIDMEIRNVGRQTIMRMVNDARHTCLQWSDVDDKGNLNAFMAVKISKKQLAQAISDNLSRSEKQEIRDRAADARREMDAHMKSFRGEQ